VSLHGSHSTGFVGFAPSVTAASGFVILAMQGADSQGTGGALLYSLGQVQIDESTGAPTGEIVWGPLTKYDSGSTPPSRLLCNSTLMPPGFWSKPIRPRAAPARSGTASDI